MTGRHPADCPLLIIPPSYGQGPPTMGLVYADLTLTNLFTGKSVPVRALVDTGATEVFVTPEVARQLGFDLEEVSLRRVVLADGSARQVPSIAPVRTHFADRSCLVDVVVLGEECLLGVVPLELMDLVVDPTRRELIFNPANPSGPCSRA
jgi:clan AA aspartic protease